MAKAIDYGGSGKKPKPKTTNTAELVKRLQEQKRRAAEAAKKRKPRQGMPGTTKAATGSTKNKTTSTLNRLFSDATGKTASPRGAAPIAARPLNAPKPKPAPKPAPRLPVGGVGGGVGGGMAPVTPAAPATPMGPAAPGPAKAPTIDDLLKRAEAYVGIELDPQINSVNRAINLANAQYGRQSGQANERGQREQSDLAEIFRRLSGFQGERANAVNQSYDQTEQRVAGNFDQLLQQLSGTFNAGEANANAELSRLGLGQVSPQATAGLQGDEALLRSLAQVDATNAQSNLDAGQNTFAGLMALSQGNAQAEGASRQAESRRALEELLTNLSAEHGDRVYDLLGERNDLENTRGTRTLQMREGLEDKNWQRQMDESDMAFNQWVTRQRLGMEMAAANAGPSYEDQLRVMDLENRVLGKGPHAGKTAKPRGRDAAYEFIRQAAGGDQRRAVDMENIFRTLETGSYLGDHDGNPKTPSIIDPKGLKFDLSNPAVLQHLQFAAGRHKDWSKKELDALIQAMNIYFGKA